MNDQVGPREALLIGRDIGPSVVRSEGREAILCAVVEKTVSAGDRAIFDMDEFLARPLYAHLAHNGEQGPRESPVWFHWDGQAIWIIGGTPFPPT